MATLGLFRCDLFDIFPPEIEIVSPREDASCVGTLSCDIDATDNRGVVKVELFLDNASIHEFTDTPYKANLDISGQSAGTKTFKAIAYDKAGNHAEDERQVRIEKETVSTPTTPTGPSSGNVGTSYSYSTGGASSSLEHSLEYRFDWGDGSYSNWSSSTTASHSWSSAGTYSVKAQARCATHTSVESSWSSSKSVTISGETISTPTTPSGTTSGTTNTSYTYSTGGASSSLEHSIEYRFDWGDGSYSNWSSSTSASHSWNSTGTKNVKAQARCAIHTGVVSSWSSSKAVTITSETVSTPTTPAGPASGNVGTAYSYSTGGSISSLGHSLQYRFFWENGDTSSWSSSTSASHSWSSAGTYYVKAQAGCATHTGVVSSWSSSMSVTISGETISTPSTPTGPSSGNVGTSYSYSTGGSTSSLGHSIQYRFDWGDGNYSSWSSSTSASHSWSSAGTYNVNAQARCATHNEAVSNASNNLAVSISEGSITVTSPNGGEDWREWSEHLITWDWSGNIGSTVSLHYSLDGGSAWTEITASALNNGSYSWTLPTISATRTACRVKVASTSTSYFDISNDDFTITNWAPVLIGSFDMLGNAMDVSVSGNYAYVANMDRGLQIIDVSNPASPTLAGTYDTPGDAWGIFVSGNYAYVADWGAGLQIIDVTPQSNPTLRATYDTPGYATDVYVGNNAYVADATSGLQIINISNITSPTLRGSYDTPDWAMDVFVLGNYAYVADHTGGLQIINISNPASPSLSGAFNTAGPARAVFVVGSYAYVANANFGLQIIDVSNPSSPTLAGSYDAPDLNPGVFVYGNYAYVLDVTDFDGVFLVINISNPSNPTLAGSYDQPGIGYDVFISGNYAYVTDSDDGLLIFDISGLP